MLSKETNEYPICSVSYISAWHVNTAYPYSVVVRGEKGTITGISEDISAQIYANAEMGN